MAKQYRTAVIIEGDAKGGIRAIQATDEQLTKLNRRFDDGGKRSRKFAKDIDGTSRELEFLKNTATGVGAALAGAFAVNNLAGQAQMIAQTDALARSLNVSTQTLQQWQYAGQQVGLEADKVGDIFKDVSDKIGDFAATGGGEAKDLFENLNLNIRELVSLSPDQQLLRIADAISQVEDPSQRTFYFESLADDMIRLQPLLANGAAGLRQAAAEADSLGVAMSDIDTQRAVEAATAMDRLNGVATGLSNTLVADLGPGLADATQSLADWIDMLGGADEALSDLMGVVTTFGGVMLARRFRAQLATAGAAGLTMGRNIATGLYAATGAAGGLNRALVMTQGRIAATAAAGRALSGALALVGGPVGAAILAASAVYHFRDELGLTVPKIEANSEAVATLTGKLDDMNRATAELQLTQLVGKLAQLKAEAKSAGEAYQEAATVGADGGGFLGVDVGAQTKAIQDVGTASRETSQEMANVEAAVSAVRGRLQTLKDQGEDTTPTIKQLGNASDEAAKAAEKYESSLQSLLDTLYPTQKSQREYQQSVDLLTTAYMRGDISQQRYLDGLDKIDQQFQNSGYWAKEYGLDVQDAGGQAEEAFVSLQDVAVDSIGRVGEQFSNMLTDFLSGAEVTIDDVKGVFARGLAEIATQATLNPIMVGIQGSLTGQTGPNGEATFSNGLSQSWDNISSLGNYGSKAWDYGKGLMGLGSVSQGAALTSGLTGGVTAAGINGAIGAAGVGYGTAGWAGSASTAAALGGTASTGMLSSAMGAVGTAMPYVGASMLADQFLFDGAISGAIGGLFGSGYTPLSLALTTGDQKAGSDYWDRGTAYQSAFGNVGYRDRGTRELYDHWGQQPAEQFLQSITQTDNAFAQIADSADQVQAMAEAVQGIVLSGDGPEEIKNQLDKRYKAAFSVLGNAFDDVMQQFSGGVDQITPLATALDTLEASLSGNAKAIADAQAALGSSDDVLATAQALAQSSQALNMLGSNADRLNIQFSATAQGALDAAGSLSELVGGIDNLSALQSRYYDAFFTDSEKFANLSSDLTDQFNAMGLALPDTREGVRSLVEGLDLMTQSGREQYAQIMQLVPLLDQYVQGVQAQRDAVQSAILDQYESITGFRPEASAGAIQLYMEQVSSGARTLEQVLQQIADQVGSAHDALSGYIVTSGGFGAANDALDQYRDAIDAVSSSAVNAARNLVDKYGSALDQINSTIERYVGSGNSGLVGRMNSALTQYQSALSDSGLDEITQTLGQYQSTTSGLLGEMQAALTQYQSALDASGLSEIQNALSQYKGSSATGILGDLQSALSQYRSIIDNSGLSEVQNALSQYGESSRNGILGTLDDAIAAYNDAVDKSTEAQRARNEQLDAEKQAVESLKDIYDSLLLSDQSILNPLERLQEAQSQFAALQVRAENGDTSAVSQIQGASQSYLDAAASYYGQSSSQYASIFGDVTGAVTDLQAQYGQSIDEIGSVADITQRAAEAQAQAHDELMARLGALKDQALAQQDSAQSSLISTLESLQAEAEAQQDSAQSSLISTLESLQAEAEAQQASAQQQLQSAQQAMLGEQEQARLTLVDQLQAQVDTLYGINNIAELLDALPGSIADQIKGAITSSGSGSSSGFDEAAYLAAYPDVAREVAQGKLDSGLEHYLKYGAAEGRSPNGSHASGLWNVPFDGYRAVLHKDEAVLPARSGIADEFRAMASGQSQKELVREVQALRQEVSMLRADRSRDAAQAADQRNQQIREQQKTSRNVKQRATKQGVGMT